VKKPKQDAVFLYMQLIPYLFLSSFEKLSIFSRIYAFIKISEISGNCGEWKFPALNQRYNFCEAIPASRADNFLQN
jgi:hypothetical protein